MADSFKNTATDFLSNTGDDLWFMECTVTPGVLNIGHAIEASVPESAISPSVQIVLDSLESPIPAVVNLPEVANIEFSVLEASFNLPRTVEGSQQSIEVTLQAPTVITQLNVTVSPSVLATHWQLLEPQIAGDRFSDTDDDRWVNFNDAWGFYTGEAVDAQVSVDTLTANYTLLTPTVAFDRTVIAYPYLKNEAGFPLYDEAGVPLPAENAMEGRRVAWTLIPPSTLSISEIHVTPNELEAAWTLLAPEVFAGVLLQLDAQAVTVEMP